MISKKGLAKIKRLWHPDSVKVYIESDIENDLPEDKKPLIQFNKKTGVFDVIQRKDTWIYEI